MSDAKRRRMLGWPMRKPMITKTTPSLLEITKLRTELSSIRRMLTTWLMPVPTMDISEGIHGL